MSFYPMFCGSRISYTGECPVRCTKVLSRVVFGAGRCVRLQEQETGASSDAFRPSFNWPPLYIPAV